LKAKQRRLLESKDIKSSDDVQPPNEIPLVSNLGQEVRGGNEKQNFMKKYSSRQLQLFDNESLVLNSDQFDRLIISCVHGPSIKQKKVIQLNSKGVELIDG
jgi:hypothetical protein